MGRALVAQWIERPVAVREVGGSSPPERTTFRLRNKSQQKKTALRTCAEAVFGLLGRSPGNRDKKPRDLIATFAQE